MVLFFVPRFAPIFAKLEEKVELPTLSRWLLWLTRLNEATFGMPMLAFIVLLILADLGMTQATLRRKRGTALNRAWFVAILLSAAFGYLLLIIALLQPVFRMGSQIG